MKKEYIKHIKTTIIGIILIGTGLYLLLNNINTDYYIIGSLVMGGIMLIFSPDTLLDMIGKYLKTKLNNKIKTE